MSKKNSIKNLVDNKKILEILSDVSISSKYKNAILKTADSKLIRVIQEIVLNLLRGNINLSKEDNDCLNRYKYTLRKFVKPSKIQNKRKVLVQRGGFLQFVLPAVITGLSTIISSVLSKQS